MALAHLSACFTRLAGYRYSSRRLVVGGW